VSLDPAVRAKLSSACALAGVLLVLLACLLPERWSPAIPLFVGLGFIAISHVLTPCQDQITQWWRRRLSR
jgi:hypothetical protein